MQIALIILISIAVIIGLLNLFKKSNSSMDTSLKDTEKKIENESRIITETISRSLAVGNDAVISGVKSTNDAVIDNVKNLSRANEQKLSEMKEELAKSLSDINFAMANNMKEVREETQRQLDQMRGIVDKKLSETLNERLTQSFSLINERLESVYKGLGEMRELAGGVTDLKKVLSNVKTKGTWAEVSLQNILDDILTSDQYVRNAAVGVKSGQRVDFAVALPGKGKEEKVYLPIDSKFPTEDYQRVVAASEGSNFELYQTELKNLEKTVKEFAKSIHGKYINPPQTTDFAVMYLPTEGLYGEVLRNAGLVEELHTRYKIIPAGPTSITALLNSLQLGFRTLAVQKSSLEVVKAFDEFRKDFGKFVENIETAKTQVEKVQNTLDAASKRTDIIQKKLNKLEGIVPPEETFEIAE